MATLVQQEPVEPPVWARRWMARAWLWRGSNIPAIRNCGRALQSGSGSVRLLRYPSGQVAASGLQTCKSVWACPVCSARIVQARAGKLQTIVNGWHGRGDRVGFLTLTVRHTAKTPLRDVWQLVMDAWKIAQGGQWSRMQKRFGVPMPKMGGGTKLRVPIVRTVEVTHGRHGWHVHLHLLVLFSGQGTAEQVRDRWDVLSGTLVSRWRDAVTGLGGRVDTGKGTAAELIDTDADASSRIGDYLAKSVFDGSKEHSAIHWETAGGTGKTSTKTGGLTPWELLDQAQHGDQRAAKLWAVWEQESRGRRQMAFSFGLLDLFGLRDGTDGEDFDQADDRAEDWLAQETATVADKRHSTMVLVGPPELVSDVPALWWRYVDRSQRIGHLILDCGSLRGDLVAALRRMGVPVTHGRDPDWLRVVVPWREWAASFPWGSW